MKSGLKYSVLGIGGVGGYLGIKLAKAGHEVHFLAHSDYDHIVKNGLKLDSVRGDISLPEVNVYKTPSDMPHCDVILVCVKTTMNHELPAILRQLKYDSAIAIIFQNGIGMEEEIVTAIPEMKVAGGPIYIASSKIGPGHIHHQDIGIITLAAYSPGIDEGLKKIASDLTQSDIKTNVTDNLNDLRWRKLVWNIPYNGLSVVLNKTTDKIVADEQSCLLSKEIMLEVIQAANANGTSIEDSFADKMVDLTRKMIPYAPSMKLDYDNRRPLEIEYIYSRAISLGKKAGVDMPKTSQLEKDLIRMDALHRNN
jgi:2-dehydropantoate 2-reductase